MNVFELFASIELDDKGYLRSLNNAESRTNKAGGNMGKAFTMFGRAAAAGTVAAGAAITAMVGKGIAEFGDLQKGMNEVFTLMPGMSEEAMQAMTDDVQAFAAEVGITTDDVVPALYNSISAGVPAENVFTFLETANMLAVGGVTDLNTAVDGLTSVTNAYGVEILSAAEASDIMFTAVKAGKTTVDEIAASIGNVAPLAASVNVGFDELNAAIATLTAQGIATPQAITGIKAAMSNILKPAGDMGVAMDNIARALINQGELTGPLVERYQALQESAERVRTQMIGLEASSPEFKALDKSLEEITGDMVELASSMGPAIIESQGFAGVLELIEDQAEGGRDGLAAMFGSVEGLNAVLALTSEEGGAAYLETLAEMQDAAGATAEAFDTMDQGIERNMERLRSQLQVFMTELGERFAPYVEDILIAARGFFEDFATRTLAFIDAIVNAYESGLFTMESMQDSQLGVLLDLWNGFYGAVEEVFVLLGSLWSRVLLPVWSAIEPFVVDLADALVDALSLAFDSLESLFGAFNALLNGDFSEAWNLFGDAIASALNGILGVGEVVFNALADVAASGARAVAGVLTGVFSAAFDAIRDGINDAIDSVNGVITRINRALEIDIPDIEFTIPNPLPGDNDFEISFDTPNIDPPDIPSIPALAAGGVVNEATLALIGEAGPEVVLPLDQYAALNGLGVAGGGLPGQVGMTDAVSAFGSYVSSFGGYIDRLVTEGIAVNMGTTSRTAALR